MSAVDLDSSPPEIRVLHRQPHAPVRHPDGSLRWDWDMLVAEARRGVEAALTWGPFASIGIDTWGVDYGLLDAEGLLLAPPYSYRDPRTNTWREVADRLGPERLYSTTGIQLMAINTVFQLAAHDRDELDRATRALLLPDLLAHDLTGEEVAERTIAGTTALVDVQSGTWSTELIADLGLPLSLFPSIVPPTTRVGKWSGVPVHAVGGHDTASAVVALPGPPAERAAFVSSGTWMLVGAERAEADVSVAARAANFSNEPGAFGGVRFLKNLMGLWMLEQCLAEWGNPPLDAVLGDAGGVRAGPVVDATDERFLAPVSMDAEVRAAAGLKPSAGRERVVRCILDSLAATTASVVNELQQFLGGPVTEVHVIGGGSRNVLLNRLTEAACGVPVRVGPAEATTLGNALAQGIALGRYRDIDEARRSLVKEA